MNVCLPREALNTSHPARAFEGVPESSPGSVLRFCRVFDPVARIRARRSMSRVTSGETPEDINYHVMDAAGRTGPRTGALDVGAQAGTTVYAPVTGMVTAIRPDPMVQGANVVEIKPDNNANVRVTVSLVRSDKANAGVTSRVTAGLTEIGTVADSAEILDPQLSSYVSDAGNHVTVSVPRVG